MLANHALPLCHLDRMHLVVSCNLSNRLDPHQGFQSYFGLEGACIPFPFSFTHSSAVFSCPAEPEKSNLASGPNFGVHFSVAELREAFGVRGACSRFRMVLHTPKREQAPRTPNA